VGLFLPFSFTATSVEPGNRKAKERHVFFGIYNTISIYYGNKATASTLEIYVKLIYLISESLFLLNIQCLTSHVSTKEHKE
jgi:hypothetical protein